MRLISRFVALVSLFLGMGGVEVLGEVRPPNFVFILMDDLGWADIGANGSSFYQTPRIDELASGGARFTAAYAACPVCSPTRASILTGKYPARLHLTDWLPGRGDQADQKLAKPSIVQQLPLDEVTIAEALQSAGYVSAHVGKWHLGGEGYGPFEQGFAVNVAGDHTGTPLSYFAPYQRNGRFMPGLEAAPEGEYLTDRLTTEAERFIEENREKPFFLYFAHYAVHIPLKAKQELIDKHMQRSAGGSQTNAVYAAMVESMDQSVGRILDKLDQLELAENTVVVFFSDNGGLATLEGPFTPATSNAPLRNGKGYLQEGGIREPLLVRWPGRVEAGRVINTPVSSIDFFPTMLEMAGVRGGSEVDGVSLLPLLTDGRVPERDALYWYYPHYANQARSRQAPAGGGPGGAVRVGDWKLIQHFESGYHELYDLSRDEGEASNLAEAFPGKVQEMAKLLYDWQNSVGAQWPMQNSGYENPAVQQGEDGRVVMHAREGFVHGKNLRYEPQPFKNTIGYWNLAEDWVHWDFEVRRGGTFRLQILQGCGGGCGGSKVAFSVGGQEKIYTVQETGHFQNFFWRDLGEVELGAGRGQLTVKPISKPGPAVMDLREVRLVPVF